LPLAASANRIRTPGFKKASSRSRLESVSQLNLVWGKIWGSGLKVVLVPVRTVVPILVTGPFRSPR